MSDGKTIKIPALRGGKLHPKTVGRLRRLTGHKGSGRTLAYWEEHAGAAGFRLTVAGAGDPVVSHHDENHDTSVVVGMAEDQAGGAAGLNDQQRLVVEAPPDRRIYLIAGAGTGKTHTLVRRLNRLAEMTDLGPTSQLLVLTFSRAAAKELRERLRGGGERGAYVKVSTFDSFATRLLSTFVEGDEWASKDYDGRIHAANALVNAAEDVQEHLGEFTHLIVDEVQDLVGVRGRFVLSVISHLDCGYTLAGDPAQSIYNFQLEARNDDFDNRAFTEALHSDSGRAPEVIALNVNYRALTPESRTALEVGPVLADPRGDYDAARGQLRGIVDELPALQKPAMLTALRHGVGSTGVLSRYNGQALALSRMMHEEGIGHRLQASATDRVLAPWLGAAFRHVASAQLTQRKLAQVLEGLGDMDRPTPEEAWSLLQRVVRTAGRSIPVRELNRRLSQGLSVNGLHVVPDSGVVVSTVHRAKGLEFDNVLIVAPGDWLDDDGADEEARITYVALTRARQAMRVLRAPAPRNLKSRGMPGDRWVWLGQQAWQRHGIECRPEDVEFRFPAAGDRFGDASRLQDYLLQEVSAGDAVDLIPFEHITPEGDRTKFLILHKGVAIGETTDRFDSDVFFTLRRGRGHRPRYPSRLEGLRIEMITTCVGPPIETERAQLGSSGFWLRPRMTGLARFDWATNEETS